MKRIVVLLGGLSALACSNPGEPAAEDTVKTPPFDTSSAPADTTRALEVFGRYTIAPFDSVTPALPTDTPDGPFLRRASSTGNDRVGTVNGRLAIWPIAAAMPTYMFPPDTVHGLTASRINNRLEVVLTSTGNTGGVYVWRDGTVKRLGPSEGYQVHALNNRGTLILMTTYALYNNFFVVRSPFTPETTPSTRLAGKSCLRGGRRSALVALNDDNELLASVERSPVEGSGTMWIAIPVDGQWRSGDCLDLDLVLTSKLPTRYSYPGVGFNVLGAAGRIGGAKTGTYPVAVITEGSHVAAVNDLLGDQPTPRPWHVTQVISIDRNQVITARAIRTADNATVLVKLTPETR